MNVDTVIGVVHFVAQTSTNGYNLYLHDALPIFGLEGINDILADLDQAISKATGYTEQITETNNEIIKKLLSSPFSRKDGVVDRKSTRLNSSHVAISYAVFCLKRIKNN